MSNPFETAEAWDAPTPLLPLGPNLVRISGPEMDQTDNGNPRLNFRVKQVNGNLDMGVRLNWTERSIGKVVALFDAAGVNRPKEGEFDPHTLALTDQCIARLDGRTVIAVVVEEAGRKDPTKMYRVVGGFTSPSDGDVPIDDSGLATSSVGASSAADDDIPF